MYMGPINRIGKPYNPRCENERAVPGEQRTVPPYKACCICSECYVPGVEEQRVHLTRLREAQRAEFEAYQRYHGACAEQYARRESNGTKRGVADAKMEAEPEKKSARNEKKSPINKAASKKPQWKR